MKYPRLRTKIVIALVVQEGDRITIFSGHDLYTEFSQILYHSITTKVMAINIQALEAVIQDVFLYHSSITSDTWCFCHIIENQRIAFFRF